jgi:phosphatidylglycerophosphate synthase
MNSTPEYQPERRPITSRDRALSKRIAHWLVLKKITPNSISVAGMVAGVMAGGAFAMTVLPTWTSIGFVAAALLMQLRLLANMFDGMVAVESGAASPVGELFNEVPDRVSDAAMFAGAGYALGGSPTLGLIAACLAIFVAYLRAQGSVAGAGQEFCGPLAKPQRVFVMTVAAIVCALTPMEIQQRLNGFTIGGSTGGIMGWVLLFSILGMIVTSIRRLSRIANHLRQESP